MRKLLYSLLIMLAVSCSPTQPIPATLAILPTTNRTQPLPPTRTSTPSTIARPTLPPTFTPTAPPTPTITETPFANIGNAPDAFPTSALGSPLTAPQNYPINITVRGGGYALDLAPPSAVRYTQLDDVYRLAIAHTNPSGEALTVILLIRDTLTPAIYVPAVCEGVGSTLQPDEDLCVRVTYHNDVLYAVNSDDSGTITVQQIDPLAVTLELSLEDELMPNTTNAQFNTTGLASVRVFVNGQARTN